MQLHLPEVLKLLDGAYSLAGHITDVQLNCLGSRHVSGVRYSYSGFKRTVR
ncbi:hypothetical protein D3C75_1140320 [compost metagenome]